jgi:hypothetical protein
MCKWHIIDRKQSFKVIVANQRVGISESHFVSTVSAALLAMSLNQNPLINDS